jgi:hydrogenase maturation protease
METLKVVILGVGNILLTDEGFGVRVIEALEQQYQFPDNVMLVNGGVQGFALVDIICNADYLIIIDVIKKNGNPGSLYRINANDIPQTINAMQSLHQMNLLTVFSLCQAIGSLPKTIILGIEPKDIESVGFDLSLTTQVQMNKVIDMILAELSHFNVYYTKREKE